MLVHFVTDEPTKIPAIRAILEPQYNVAPQLLGVGDTKITSNGVLMVDADLRKAVLPYCKIICCDREPSEPKHVSARICHQASRRPSDFLGRQCDQSANKGQVWTVDFYFVAGARRGIVMIDHIDWFPLAPPEGRDKRLVPIGMAYSN